MNFDLTNLQTRPNGALWASEKFAEIFALGAFRVTKGATRLEDLAKLAGVSISTASRALNDSPAVNKRTKQLIWKLAREMDYPFRRETCFWNGK